MEENKTCGTCVRYADLHSSCGLVRDFKVKADTPACEDFYKEEKRRMSYWSNITEIYARQRSKGVRTYGQTLEQNTSLSDVERLEYLEEELVDALMYIEHIKSGIKKEVDDGK